MPLTALGSPASELGLFGSSTSAVRLVNVLFFDVWDLEGSREEGKERRFLNIAVTDLCRRELKGYDSKRFYKKPQGDASVGLRYFQWVNRKQT